MGKLRILVTGASGLIGRNIYETLVSRDDVDVVGVTGRRQVSGMQSVDLTDGRAVSELVQNFDVVVHAAAKSSGSHDIVNHPEVHVSENIIINTLLFQAAHKAGVGHVVFLSSGVVYPQRVVPQMFAEDDVDLRNGFFPQYFGVGWMKVCAEKLAEFYSGLGKTRYLVIRPSNVYGLYDKFDLERSHVLGATIAKVMTARDGESITVWGDGSAQRDFLHVRDLCAFVSLVVERCIQQNFFAGYDVVNIASGSMISVSDLVRKVIEVSGRTLAIQYDTSKPTIPTKVSFDVAKAKRVYGWTPKIALELGIRETLEWYQENY